MIDYETFESVFKRLYEEHKKRDEYLDKYPADFAGFLVENEYCTSLGRMLDYIGDKLFGKFADEVNWFLYDKPKNPEHQVISTPEKKYPVRTVEEFLAFIKEFYYEKD